MFNKYDIDSWGMFGVLIGYVFFFRFIQYLLFALQTGTITLPFLGQTADQEGSGDSGVKQSYRPVPTADKKDQSGLEIATVGPGAAPGAQDSSHL